jgi:hypothetical protein
MVGGIVMKEWILLSGNIVIIVLCCEVLHLLVKLCLGYGCVNLVFVAPFFTKLLHLSLRRVLLTELHRPPLFCLFAEMQDHMLH